MAQLLGPDIARRAVTQVVGSNVYEYSGRSATVYLDDALTQLAPINTFNAGSPTTPGALIANSQVTLSARNSRLPLWWFPDGVDTLYVSVSGLSHSWMVTADVDSRLDTLTGGAGIRRAALTSFAGLAPSGQRAAGPISSLLTTHLGGTSRMFVPVPDQTQTSFLPVYENYYGGADAPGANAFTLAAAVEVGSTIVPFTFGGQHTVALAPGGTAIPDNPIAVPLTSVAYTGGAGTGSATGFWLRTYISVTSGQSYPVNVILANTLVSGEVDGASVAGGADLTLPGSGTVTTGPGGTYAFGPRAILSRSKTSRLFAAVGDSIINGQADSPSMYGYIDRAAVATSTPILKVGRPGDTASNFALSTGRFRRAAMIEGATDVFVAYGVNDLNNGGRSAAQLQADLTAIYALLAGMGARVHAVTIGPRTTSSDSFATTVNQVATGSGGTVLPATLAAVNDWIRTKPTNVYDVYDFADLVMSARNSGLWAVDGTANKYTPDGTHPGPFTYQSVLTPALTTYITTYKASAAYAA